METETLTKMTDFAWPSFFILSFAYIVVLEKLYFVPNQDHFWARLPGRDLIILLGTVSSYFLGFLMPVFGLLYKRQALETTIWFKLLLLHEYRLLKKLQGGQQSAAELSNACFWVAVDWFCFSLVIVLAFIEFTDWLYLICFVLAAFVRSGIYFYHGLCLNQKFAAWIGYRNQE